MPRLRLELTRVHASATWAGVLAIVLVPYLLSAQRGAPARGDWPVHSGDQAATKYSPLDQITASNVQNLKVAWRRPGVDPALLAANPDVRLFNNFRNTPIMVDGVLYASNAIGLVEAMDPGTGKTLWMQEPMGTGPARLQGTANRGVAHWRGGQGPRIFSVRGEYLFSVDPKTGELDARFGDAGKVDLRVGLGPRATRFGWTSPPVVIRDTVVVGSSMAEQDSAVAKEGAPGDVRGYDARTGELKWTFHVIPREGDPATKTWEDESWRYTGAGNVWAPIAADEELGYVYLPTSSATNDMYGGHRLGDNLYTSSLVCLDAATGKKVWHYQIVHHDLFDYDNPAAPILADITVNGRRIKAVVQITKQSFAYVFDRVTGVPVWPIEERPVPASTVPGEKASPTQPFPTKPAPFERQGISVDDLIDFTPELRAQALDIVKPLVMGPLFTPPSVRGDGPGETKGTIELPGSVGGADWTGAALDPETGVLYVPSMTNPFVADLVKSKPGETNLDYRAGGRALLQGPQGLPLTKPPYGRITAIDLNRGEHLWMVPNGDGPRNHPAIKHLNLPPLGQAVRAAPLVTKTLLFVSEGDQINVRTPPNGGGRALRAYDKRTGKVVWETTLDAGTTGTLATYLHNGKQYLVMAIGSRDHRAEFIAFSL